MRDGKITVEKVSGILITLARTAPIQTTLIVKNNNGIIETLSVLKQDETSLLGTTPTVPRDSPTVPNYWITLYVYDPMWSHSIEVSA